MATTGFRRRMMTIYHSSADAPTASRSFDVRTNVKAGLLALAFFYAVVIGILALRIMILNPDVGQ